MLTVTPSIEVALKDGSIRDSEGKHWRPTPKQGKFIELPFEIDEAGYGGALGSGKTDLLMLLPLIYQLYEAPKFKGIMFRRTFPELEQEVIPRSREFYPSTGATYNEQKKRWNFPNGGYDRFGHLEHETDVKKYDGAQYNIIRWDEATAHTQYQYEYLVLRRNRSSYVGGPAFTRWGSNPGGPGHSYFRKRFIDPARQGFTLLRDSKTGSLRYFIPAVAKDNKHLLEANPRYFDKLQGITSEAERRAMILGDWYTFEGQVFDEFRIEPFFDEPPNARHVIDPFPIPYWWPKIISIDWGMSASTYIIWYAIAPNGRVYIYRTMNIKGAKIKQWTRDMALLSAGEIDNVRDIRICWSAVQDHGRDQTIEQQVAEAIDEAGFSCGLTKGEKNRIGGKQLVHEYLRWKPLPSLKDVIGEYDRELANRIWRNQGDKALAEYTKYFEPEKPELNLPKLQIFKRSPEGRENEDLIDCIPNCIYNTDKNKEDVAEFIGDDPYDSLRIGLYAVRDYFDESYNEFGRQSKLIQASAAIKGIEAMAPKDQLQAQTSFYRQCEMAEALDKEQRNYSVRRISGRGYRRH
jgi:hypothetical protein